VILPAGRRIHLRIRGAHFLRLLPGVFDLHQGAFAHARAISRGLFPLAAAFQQFGPEGEDAALRGLCRVNGAAALAEKMTLRIARHAQARPPCGPVHVFAFELGDGHAQEIGDPLGIPFRQIDKALLGATFRTSGLALEPQPLGHLLIIDLKVKTTVIYFRVPVGERGGCMSRVRDIVHDKELFFVEETDTVAGAARRMEELQCGAILVLKSGELRGVFSERDLMRRVVLEHRDPETTLVAEVMSTNVKSIDEMASLEEAMQAMTHHGCRHLPVLRGGRVVSFLSMRDLMHFELAVKTEEITHMRAYIHGT